MCFKTCVVLNFLFMLAYISCCELKPNDKHSGDILKRLDPLKGKTLNATLTDSDGGTHSYFLAGICSCPKGDNSVIFNDTISFGTLKKVDLSSGKNYIILSYYGNDVTGTNDCNKTGTMSNIIFVCDPNTDLGSPSVLEKYHNAAFCSATFKVGTHYACETKDGLSSGSIFCILFFTAISIYLLLGFLYQRLLVGAKGLEQIPNYGFWRDFGNLQADGCDFLCRCGPRQEAQSYRGIDDRLPRDDERDDQLLNM